MNLCFFERVYSHWHCCCQTATPILTDHKGVAAGRDRLEFSVRARSNLMSLRTQKDWGILCLREINEDVIISTPVVGEVGGFSTPRPLSTTKLSSPVNGANIQIAYRGFPGASSEAAALKLYPKCETVPCDEYETALKAVELWTVDKAVLPMECSVDGTFHRNYDLLLRHNLYIVREVEMIFNHPVPGLSGVTEDDKQDDLEKVTRFQILAREPIVPGTDKPYKTSIAFTLKEGPGVLFKVLALFANRGINLLKIESRPLKWQPLREGSDNNGRAVYFNYVFYIDFEASMAESHAQNAIRHLQELTKFFRVLGCYKVDALV